MTDQPPPSWTDPKIVGRVIGFESTLQRWLIFHGALVLAAKHPEVGASILPVIEEMATHLEEAFEVSGLERPEAGWRHELEEPA